MKFTLRIKYAIAFFLIALAGFLLLITWGRSLARKQAENDAVNSMYRTANYIATLYHNNTGAVNREFLNATSKAGGYELWIMDLNGKVVAATGREQLPSVPDFQPSGGTDGYYMSGTFYGTFPEPVLTVYSTLARDAAPRGYVLLHQYRSVITANADRMQFFAYMSYFSMLALVLLFFIFLDLFTVRPIQKVLAAGREYANQNLTYPTPVIPNDEIGEIALTEQELAKQLQSSADDQHKFLQNISHDFRSPLTSIRGYMVAMQDGTIPPEMQGKYLDVVIGETDRLTTMANELLDVTQLENGVILDRTEFDLNDLIREVLPSFEGRAREKSVTFEVQFENAAQMVYADRPRIQQVIHNLIDNAIKFSGNDATIDISTHVSGGKVFTSVKDHGVGIEPENIQKIWNRFYKTDPSRGKDRKGTGLGLSIVRDIIQNHKENIDVISTPGVGTEFIFTLPAEEE